MKRKHEPIKRFKQILCSTLAIAMCVTALSGSSMAVAWAAEAATDTHTVTLAEDPDDNGMLYFDGQKSDVRSAEFAEGDTVTVDFTAAAGYSATTFTVTADDTGESVSADISSGDTGFTFTMPNGDVTVSAVFEETGEDDYGIETLAHELNDWSMRPVGDTAGNYTGETITAKEFYSLFEMYMNSPIVKNTAYAETADTVYWNSGTRWDCSSSVLYFLSHFLLPYLDDPDGYDAYYDTYVSANSGRTGLTDYDKELCGSNMYDAYTAPMMDWGKVIVSGDTADFTDPSVMAAVMEPGDIIFYGKYENNKPASVSHVAMYLGDGKYLSDLSMTNQHRSYSSGTDYQVENVSGTSLTGSPYTGLSNGVRTSPFRIEPPSGSSSDEVENDKYGYVVEVIRMCEVTTTGYLTLEKSSTNTSITNGNNCYSFDGAVYWIYEDLACTTRAKDADGNYAVLTTDANGHANTIEMETGTYYAKEVTAPKGYILEEDYDPSSAVHVVTVDAKDTEDSPAVITVTECPANDPGNITIYKEDAETGEAYAQGGASLEGAQFTVCYYDYDGSDYESYVEKNEPTRTWVIETKYSANTDTYYAKLDDGWKVSGGDFYYNNGFVALPLGTYTIQETKAPTGYLIQGDFVYSTSGGNKAVGSAGDVFVTQLLYGDDLFWEKGGNYYTQEEEVKRGDFEFEKKNGETQERMANIPFSITSVTTGESHIVYTDENGYYSTSANYIPHSENTNSDEPDSGVWFGLNSNGENVPVDDTKGALPYDKYVVEEIPCDENSGMEMISFTVTVSRDNWLIDYGTEENWPEEEAPHVLSIRTMAWSGDTGTQVCYADGYVTLYDDVYYTGLTVGEEYYIYGVALDADTREPEYDHNGEKIYALTSFTALTEDGMEVQEFYFDVEDLSGHRVVFYETIYQIDEDGNAVLVMAEDPDDYANETIYFPQVGTVLTDADTGEHYTARDGEITFVDTVSVTGVPAGMEATVIGTLMLKSTGEPLLDENGDPVTAQITYTSTGLTSNTVEITFSYDVSDVIGDTVVAFEDLYIAAHNREYDGTDDGESGELVLVGRHADLDDTDQSVEIKTPGSIETSMTNGPKTSDIILMVVFAAVLAAAIIAIVVVLVQRKRKMAKQDE